MAYFNGNYRSELANIAPDSLSSQYFLLSFDIERNDKKEKTNCFF